MIEILLILYAIRTREFFLESGERFARIDFFLDFRFLGLKDFCISFGNSSEPLGIYRLRLTDFLSIFSLSREDDEIRGEDEF